MIILFFCFIVHFYLNVKNRIYTFVIINNYEKLVVIAVFHPNLQILIMRKTEILHKTFAVMALFASSESVVIL